MKRRIMILSLLCAIVIAEAVLTGCSAKTTGLNLSADIASLTQETAQCSNPTKIHTFSFGKTKSFLYLSDSQNENSTSDKPYGVFIGLGPENISRLAGYGTVVIDAAYFTAQDIKSMHEAGQKVYSYLNVGSIEKFRSYYKKFKSITLGAYENWPDERWINVSKSKWQKYVVKTLAASLVKKHIDGFFIDNTDVYYVYHKKKIYNGLVSILSGLKKYKLPIIINGGDTFVTALKNKGRLRLIKGVNQESVFTSIDFDNNTLGIQDNEDHEHYCNYLSMCKNSGLSVYLLEYASDPDKVKDEIDVYCKENGFLYYISKSLDLD